MYSVYISINCGKRRENVALGEMLMANVQFVIGSCSLPGAVSLADGISWDGSFAQRQQSWRGNGAIVNQGQGIGVELLILLFDHEYSFYNDVLWCV